MNSITIDVDTNPEKYFLQLIEILKVISPFDQLRKRQREVFAEILYQFHVYRNESKEVREILVFDHKTKEQIADKLGISKGNLYNIYKELRQFNLLTKDGINEKFIFGYLRYGDVKFKFKEQKEKGD